MRNYILLFVLLWGCSPVEEIKKELISSVAYAQSSGITVVDLDPGDSNCPPGGLRITVGSQDYYVCNGMPGQNGYQGVRGLTGDPGPFGSSSTLKAKDKNGNLISNIYVGSVENETYFYWDGSNFWRITQDTGNLVFSSVIPLYYLNDSNCNSSTPFASVSSGSNYVFKNTDAISNTTYWTPGTSKEVQSGICYRSNLSGCVQVPCPAAWRNITQVTTLPDVSTLFAFPIYPVLE